MNDKNDSRPSRSLKVAVFCSSRSDLPEDVERGARMIASAIGRNGATMVYGGVNAGLMHVVAAAASDSGAVVRGIVPEVFRDRADDICSELIWASDLNHRKALMIADTDIFIVLPGGLGTIDEWISTLSDIMVREKVDPNADRPILVWNHQGMYDGMVRQLADTAMSVYARGKRVDRSLIFNSAEQLTSYLDSLLSKPDLKP